MYSNPYSIIHGCKYADRKCVRYCFSDVQPVVVPDADAVDVSNTIALADHVGVNGDAQRFRHVIKRSHRILFAVDHGDS